MLIFLQLLAIIYLELWLDWWKTLHKPKRRRLKAKWNLQFWSWRKNQGGKNIYCLSEKKLFLFEYILLKKVFLYSLLKLFFINALWNYITQKKQCSQQKVEDFLHKENDTVRFSKEIQNVSLISTLITCECVVTFRATIYTTFLSNYKNVCIYLKKT